MSMVHCLQMEAKTSPTVLGFLTELSALFLYLSEECRREARRGKVEAKSQQEALGWVDWAWLLGSLPAWGSKNVPPEPPGQQTSASFTPTPWQACLPKCKLKYRLNFHFLFCHMWWTLQPMRLWTNSKKWTHLRNNVVSPLLADLSWDCWHENMPVLQKKHLFPPALVWGITDCIAYFLSPLQLRQEGCKSRKWVCKTFNCTHGTDHCWKQTRCQYLSSIATCSYNPFHSNLSCTVTSGRF